MPRCCSVPECKTYVEKGCTSLYYFPVDLNLQKVWKDVLKIGKPISKYMCVCSKHFSENDFIKSYKERKFKRLKRGAVPSKNLPNVTSNVTGRNKNVEHIRKTDITEKIKLLGEVEKGSIDNKIFLNSNDFINQSELQELKIKTEITIKEEDPYDEEISQSSLSNNFESESQYSLSIVKSEPINVNTDPLRICSMPAVKSPSPSTSSTISAEDNLNLLIPKKKWVTAIRKISVQRSAIKKLQQQNRSLKAKLYELGSRKRKKIKL